MKTKITFLSIIASFFITQMEAQNSTVNAMSNEISDNLDLRAVASIFGDSKNLEDFERRLNDPEIQISNLDLNNDDEVDYLRVIENVENNTHVVIIQSVLDRDVYQDVATIDVERSNNNSVQVHIVGNEYMYGPDYIYQPVYYSTPLIYASFWSSNYRPYVSNWYWNNYPSYYYAWNPYPVYRYRNNIHLSLNVHNSYNYVNYRRSNVAISLYSSRRTNGYERRYPDYAFSKRNTSYSNRHDLEQRRSTRYSNSANRNTTGRQYNSNSTTRRDYSSNRSTPSRDNTAQRSNTRSYSENKSTPSRQNTATRNYSPNANSDNKNNSTRNTESRNSNRNYTNSTRENSSQGTTNRNFNQNNSASGATQNNTQRTTRNFNQNNNTNSSRENRPQQSASSRSYSPRQESNRGNSQQSQATPSRSNTQSSPAPQRAESSRSRSSNQENNNSSRNNNRRI